MSFENFRAIKRLGAEKQLLGNFVQSWDWELKMEF